MGTRERRARERQARVEGFIDAAERLFFKQGYENTSIEQLARSVEFSKRTIYIYFRDKQELFLAVVHRCLARLLARLEKAVSGAGLSGREQLLRLFRAYNAFSRSERHRFQAIKEFELTVYGFGKTRDARGEYEVACLDLNDQMVQLAIRAIEQGYEEGSIRSTLTPLQLTLLVWGQLMGVQQAIQAREADMGTLYETTGEALLEAHWELLMSGLQGSRSA